MDARDPAKESDTSSGLVPLALAALVAGAATGAIGASFLLALEGANEIRDWFVASAHAAVTPAAPIPGLLIVMAASGVACLVGAWLVRRFSPFAQGSGIPVVEGVLRYGVAPAAWPLVPVKFVGGVLAIGAGLALGREGPMIQMGAHLSYLLGKAGRLPRRDTLVLLAAGSGAGLATAFNAPLAGAALVLEEVFQAFDPRITMATLTASATAIAVSRAILGNALDFQVGALPNIPWPAHPLFFALGLAIGLLAVAYNKAILGATALAERIPLPVEARAGLIGMAVGALAWIWPEIVSGGDPLAQGFLTKNLVDSEGLAIVALILVVRFFLGPISFAAGTPGGLLAPLLVIGAGGGYVFGFGCAAAFPDLGVPPASFALVGMAAFFAGTVRAPLTGLVLVVEMTGNVTLLLPGLEACAFAMLITEALRDTPIYDALGERMFPAERAVAKAGPRSAAAGTSREPR